VVERYEQLRAAVLDGVGEGFRHGWGVLARGGMAAWAAAVGRIPPARRAPVAPAPAREPLADRLAGELVQVIAGIVLAWPAPG
jgi:hypothetical protein